MSRQQATEQGAAPVSKAFVAWSQGSPTSNTKKRKAVAHEYSCAADFPVLTRLLVSVLHPRRLVGQLACFFDDAPQANHAANQNREQKRDGGDLN